MVDKVEAELTFNEKKAIAAVDRLSDAIENSSRKMVKRLDKVDKAFENIKESIALGNIAANVITKSFQLLTSSVADSVREQIEFEKAQVGVIKTTDLSAKEMSALVKQITALSTVIPISRNELLGLAETAGQLGVRGVKNLTKFSETIAKLAVATDLAGEQGAKSILRILNVTDEGVEGIDDFANALVSLGNQAKASESEIIRVANEVARSTAQFELSSAEVLALATTLRELGIQAQLGGSVAGKAIREISKIIREGGSSFERLQQVTQMTGEQLKKTFKDDAVSIFKAFLTGINRAAKGGKDLSQSLEEFGLKGDEVNKVLPVLAKNMDDYARNSDVANKAIQEGSALNKEAARAFDTLGSALDLAGNNLLRFGGDMASVFTPAMRTALDVFNALFKDIEQSTIDEQIENINGSILSLLKALEKTSNQDNFIDRLFGKKEVLSERIEELKKIRAELVKTREEQAKPIKKVDSKGKEITGGGESESAILTNTEKKLQIDLQTIRAQAGLIEEERRLKVIVAQGKASQEDIIALRSIEEQKINIKSEAEFKKSDLIKSEQQKRLEQEKIFSKNIIAIEKLRTISEVKDVKTEKADEEKLAKQQAELDKKAEIAKTAEMKLQSDLQAIKSEAELSEIERQLSLKDARGEATAEDFERLRQIEIEKIIIIRDAELAKADLIKNAQEKAITKQKINAKAQFDIDKKTAKDEQMIAKQKQAFEKMAAQQSISLVTNTGNFINAVAGKQTKAGFVLSKIAAAASVLVAHGTAQAQATSAAAGAASVSGTAAPAVFKLTLAQMQGIITANTVLALGTIAATTIGGFQDGGIIPGVPSAGGRDNRLASVASGELILNRAQQGVVASQMTSNELMEAMIGRLDVLIAKDTSVQIDGREIARTVQIEQESGFEVAS